MKNNHDVTPLDDLEESFLGPLLLWLATKLAIDDMSASISPLLDVSMSLDLNCHWFLYVERPQNSVFTH